jgi:hypothetical protein
MAYTSEDLTKVEAAIASGVMRVRYADGKQVDYQSVADLIKARDLIKRTLEAVAGTRPSYRDIIRTRSGLA